MPDILVESYAWEVKMKFMVCYDGSDEAKAALKVARTVKTLPGREGGKKTGKRGQGHFRSG